MNRRPLFFYFFAPFFVAFLCLAILLFSSYQRTKSSLEESHLLQLKTRAYEVGRLISSEGSDSGWLKSIKALTKYENSDYSLRLSVFETLGNVFFDSHARTGDLPSVISLPEITECLESGDGSDIRLSSSLDDKYMYYAYRDQDRLIRTSYNYSIVRGALYSIYIPLCLGYILSLIHI